ncbi:hypothetical protein AMAG_20237 [Allomyces macrogynus ATCC 38327]|uniref:Uncharacterized protein n=1 Tax=Allomyces macrogynus (strain ATCC 38327) TaxID=578462 RepID=A0A0L0T5X9_ALLM3|nr:hypothetical protein AMAG_20237 [Allomyces macrogynus ATCC 38327]|eukprot:KNE70091.1 hypothetical protein AMAG_20237 [Allomyces macrogynus ATCC 38327]
MDRCLPLPVLVVAKAVLTNCFDSSTTEIATHGEKWIEALPPATTRRAAHRLRLPFLPRVVRPKVPAQETRHLRNRFLHNELEVRSHVHSFSLASVMISSQRPAASTMNK